MTLGGISGNLVVMGFLRHLRQDLQQSLADQQRLAVVQVLRKRFATLTFDDIRHLLTSPLGKGLGPMLIAEVLVAPPEAVTPTASTKPKATDKPAAKKKKKTPRTKAKAKKRSKPARPRRAASAKNADQPKQIATDAGTAPPPRERETRRTAKSTARARSTATPQPVPGPDWRPPGMSPEQAAEMARYGEAVLATIRKAGDWVAASEIREQVGKSSEQLRLALRKLETSGDIVRTGQRGHTRYKAAVTR